MFRLPFFIQATNSIRFVPPKRELRYRSDASQTFLVRCEQPLLAITIAERGYLRWLNSFFLAFLFSPLHLLPPPSNPPHQQ